jgi:RND family efflux transporter MFP subunit
MVSPMETVAVIADINRIHVLANVEEDDIRRIRVGQSAIVTIDPFGNREFTGYVSEVGLITTSELSGTALFFNTGGNFTRVTHLIPIKITIVDDDIHLENFIGVNARVRISLRQAVNQPIASSLTVRQNVVNISTNGTVESVQSRNIYTTLGSIIERVNVEVGDIVRKGQVLAMLETAELRSQMASAEATLRMADINLETAEHNHRTFSELSATGSVPRDNVQQLEFALQTALAYRQQAQAMLNAVRVHLDRSTLTSPINGTVTKVIAQEGEIGMGRMFVVEDTENLKIVTRFREHDLSRISTEMEVTIIPKGNTNARYTGIISRINPSAVPHSPIVEFETEILVTSPNNGLRIGMGTRVEVRN